MFEKVNPAHPDKIADRIAGAIVDEAYRLQIDPRIAVEVLIGHGEAKIITETSVRISPATVDEIVQRIAQVPIKVDFLQVPQDTLLAKNQEDGFRCGDNGIFRGCLVSGEQFYLTSIAKKYWSKYKRDGKYIQSFARTIICQSGAGNYQHENGKYVNPLGDWTGGLDVDTGATNRKLGSDMGDALTGGGLHGKDLSKADVSVNIYLHLLAREKRTGYEAYCAIGDKYVRIKSEDNEEYAHVLFRDIVEAAREYIVNLGGFEKFAEWGLIR